MAGIQVIVRTEDEINEQLNLAAEGQDSGSKYPGQSYEDGIRAMFDWLVGDTEDTPLGGD